MDSSASSRKHARDEGIKSNPEATPNQGKRSRTTTSTLKAPKLDYTSNSTTDTPTKKRSGHTKGHMVQVVPVDYLLNERKDEAKIVVEESIVTHKLLQVVRPREPTVLDKAQAISASVAASLESYIDDTFADDSETSDPVKQLVRDFCAPHDKSGARFSKESEMYPAIDALFGYISEQIFFDKDKDLKNYINVFGKSDFSVSDGDTSLRIDKALRIDFDEDEELEDNDADTKGGNADKTGTATYRNIFAVVEAKVDNQAKVEDTTNPEVIANDKMRVEATVQLYLYTHNIYFRQHTRRFAWGFTVCGSVFQACLFTHDVMVRSGGIDVATEHGRKELVELFTNMSFCDSDQLGYDPTIFLNDAAEWEMNVFEGGKARRCTVLKVTLAADRAFGRHTRCFHCKTIPDSDSKEVSKDVLVKDAWAHRSRSLGKLGDTRDEAVLLRTLSNGFRSNSSLANKYPNLWAGGIVRQTGSDGNSEDDTTDRIFAPLDQDVFKTIPLRVHRRLAMEPLGEPLRTAKVVDETIIAIADAMEVYMAAWRNHRIMHRDISTSNILIRRDPTTGEFLNGALIDFDCAIMESSSNEQRTDQRPNMTGTFPFMSVNCLAASSDDVDLRETCVSRTILDDWESVVYVLCWLGTFGINYEDSAAVMKKARRGVLPISQWRTGNSEEAARAKMGHLASAELFDSNILRKTYEPSSLDASLSDPSPTVAVSYKPLKLLLKLMRIALFENPNLSQLGHGMLPKLAEDAPADIPTDRWDSHLGVSNLNPFSRRAQLADNIGNALLEVMIAARTEAWSRINGRRRPSQ